VSTFDRAGGGESPARPTLSLVLDRCDSTTFGPIERVGENWSVVFLGHVLRAEKRSLDAGVAEVLSRELFRGEVSELVDADGEGVVLLFIHPVNFINIALEDVVTREKISGGVILGVRMHEASEFLLVVRFRVSEDAGAEQSSN